MGTIEWGRCLFCKEACAGIECERCRRDLRAALAKQRREEEAERRRVDRAIAAGLLNWQLRRRPAAEGCPDA